MQYCVCDGCASPSLTYAPGFTASTTIISEEASPAAFVPSSRTKKLWGKIKMAGRIAAITRSYREDSEEKIRKERIKQRWDIVRKIARASMALCIISRGGAGGNSDEAQHAAGFANYEAFQVTISKPAWERTERDIDRLPVNS